MTSCRFYNASLGQLYSRLISLSLVTYAVTGPRRWPTICVHRR